MKRDGFGPSAAMLVIVSAALSGCGAELVPTPAESSGTNEAHANGDPRITEAMSKLDAEDRKLAEAQKYCAISHSSPLGSMGTPIKLDVKGQPVFICCEGCQAQALENPDETLAKVAELKAANSGDAASDKAQH